MTPPAKKDFRTVDDCNKIHEIKRTGNRWTIGILATCLLCTVGILSRAFMAHAENDSKQDVAIARIEEKQKDHMDSINQKLDLVIQKIMVP